MTPEIAQLLAVSPPALVAVLLGWWFLRYIRGRDEADADREARFVTLVENHIAENTRVLREVSEGLARLNGRGR